MPGPTHILALKVSDPDFAAHCLAWTHQMRSDMDATVGLTKDTLATSKVLMKEADILLARR